MALPLDRLGTVYGGHRATIDRAQVIAYAAATNDDHPAHRSGASAPPVFGAVPTRAALSRAAARMVPPDALSTVLHGEQDMHFHRLLLPGQEIVTTAEAHSVRAGASRARLTFRLQSLDAGDGRLVLDQFVTVLVQGTAPGDGGPDKPSHIFPEEARARPVAAGTFHVDADQTFRYRDASGDDMPIHVDEAYARRLGLPGIVVHGLCTLAMASQVLVGAVAAGEPGNLRRLAVRFCGLVLPGDDVRVSIYRSPGGDGPTPSNRYHFETGTNRGQAALCHGLAEVDG